MFGAFALLLATTLLAFPAASRIVHAGGARTFSTLRTTTSRPQIVENGTDLVTFPYVDQYAPPSIAFTPNGDAYFVDELNNLVRLAPDGTYTETTVPHVVQKHTIIYARANIWMGAADGLVKIDPDGTHYHHYTLSQTMNSGLAFGPDDAIYADARVLHDDGTITGRIYRIDTHGVVSSVAVPVQPGDIAFGSDGRLYFTYTSLTAGAWGIAQLQANGSTKLFQVATQACCQETETDSSLVLSNGNLYFEAQYNNISWFFGKIAPSGVITQIPLPYNIPTEDVYGSITADHGGNIWLNVGDIYFSAPTSGLYQFNVYTGHYNGPYETSVFGQFVDSYSGPFTGPDDNIWFAYQNDLVGLSVGAYVTHIQTLEPGGITVTAATPGSFTILETHFNGPWTASSLNPAVATVSPASSTTGDFTVTETGPGVTSIAVKDRLGNVSYELVTAH